MNNDHYIAALKRALGGMDRASRDEILREIQSHIAELGEHESLRDRFGPAEELAASYLDGEPLPAPLSKKALGLGRRVLLGLGMATGALVLIGVLLAWLLPDDDFDYADENARELQIDSAEWQSMAWHGALNVRVDQARAVFYWHDDDRLSWHCTGRTPLTPTPGKTLEIRHGQCLIYLPAQTAEMEIIQAEAVLVRPRADTQLSVNQANLRIAENGVRYRYQFDLKHSDSDPFESQDEAETLITVSAREASIETYQYR